MPADALEPPRPRAARRKAIRVATYLAVWAVAEVVLAVWLLANLNSLLGWVLVTILLAAYVTAIVYEISLWLRGEYDRQPLPPGPIGTR